MTVEGFVLAVNYAILGYFLLLNGFYLMLYVISFRVVSDYARREVFSGFSELANSQYAPGVSLIVPAYNEEATIAASVRSFLALNYPTFEIVVINDGSSDRTVEILRREFDLKASDQSVQNELQTQPINAVYTSATEKILVVDKDNGGKADALNAGICAARYPLICCIDADVILEEDALLRLARPMIESSDVAAVGGHRARCQRMHRGDGARRRCEDLSASAAELPDRGVPAGLPRWAHRVELTQRHADHLRRFRHVPARRHRGSRRLRERHRG